MRLDQFGCQLGRRFLGEQLVGHVVLERTEEDLPDLAGIDVARPSCPRAGTGARRLWKPKREAAISLGARENAKSTASTNQSSRIARIIRLPNALVEQRREVREAFRIVTLCRSGLDPLLMGVVRSRCW